MKIKFGILDRWQEVALRVARWLVVGFAIFQGSLALASIMITPAFIRENYAVFKLNDAWTPNLTQTALQSLGWPVQTLAWLDYGLDILNFTISYILAFILLRRKSQDAFGLYLALAFFMMGGFTGRAIDPLLKTIPVMDYLVHQVLGAVGWQFFFIVFFLFPDGKPVPGWSRWIIVSWLGFMIFSAAPIETYGAYKPVIIGIAIAFVIASVGSQVYRQFTNKSTIQKQQTKWVAYSLAMSVIIMLPLGLLVFRPLELESLTRDFILALIFKLLVSLQAIAIVSSVMIAILKYRLYDIDRLISRTLIYFLLTGLLGLVYFGSVALLQGMVPTEEGKPSPVIIVITTLVIATLFNPLRVRLQNTIDRRFYRHKYDAEKALADFAAAARSETDLSQLSTHLNATVSETLQPEQVRLWLSCQDRS